jgi:hypothetical protein
MVSSMHPINPVSQSTEISKFDSSKQIPKVDINNLYKTAPDFHIHVP